MKFNTMSNRDVVAELCQRMRARRIELRLSQEDVARAAGIGIATLKRIEGGQTANLMTTVALLRALDGIEQLESLLFSSRSTGSTLADSAPSDAQTQRIRKKSRPAKPRPTTLPRGDDEHDYLITTQNNVSWGLPGTPRNPNSGSS